MKLVKSNTLEFPAYGMLRRSPAIECLPSKLYEAQLRVLKNVQKVEEKIFKQLRNEPMPEPSTIFTKGIRK